ncbi:MAG: DUF3854 domain-containing protein [Planctomycetota bacterium]
MDAAMLSAGHRQHLRESGLDDQIVRERGYFTATTKSQLERLGFTPRQRLVPALVVPVHNVTGESSLTVIRPDHPRISKGKRLKYEFPSGATMQLDVPPRVRPDLASADKPLWITEGSKMADAGAQRGLACIALLGVWNFRGKHPSGGTAMLPDFEYIHLKGRSVYIVFDSDVMIKHAVNLALQRFARALHVRGAVLRYVYLPCGPGGTKVGLDDYFVAGGSADGVLGHASDEIRQLADPTDTAVALYESRDGVLWHNQRVQDRVVPTQLTTFDARIIVEDTHDDGAVKTKMLTIDATLGGQTYTFDVAASHFAKMDWVSQHLPTGAYVLAISRGAHHAANAIQEVSREAVVARTTYAHSGWRRIDNEHVYLHGGGAITRGGTREDIRVALPQSLQPLHLPKPPEGEDLSKAVGALLDLINLGPSHVMAPVFCLPFRAAIGKADVSGYLLGESGIFKTELAALCQQFYGAGFNARVLPAGFSSTVNSLEALAHHAKDALMVIDDFAPQGSKVDIDRKHGDLDRVLRGTGNRQGRERMNPDGTLCPPRPPRALVLATGEVGIRMRSGSARTISIRLRAGDIQSADLHVAQRAGASGLYASCMAAFLKWLAPHYDELMQSWPGRLDQIRQELVNSSSHKRMTSSAAELILTGETLAEFMRETGLVSRDRVASLLEWLRTGILLGLARASEELEEAEPTVRFRELLCSAIQSGQAHIASAAGGAPGDAELLGWRRPSSMVAEGSHTSALTPGGSCVGYIDERHLMLNFTAAYGVASEVAGRTSQPLQADATSLKRYLLDRGDIVLCEKGRPDKKMPIAGGRMRVVCLRNTWLSNDVDESEQDEVVL